MSLKREREGRRRGFRGSSRSTPLPKMKVFSSKQQRNTGPKLPNYYRTNGNACQLFVCVYTVYAVCIRFVGNMIDRKMRSIDGINSPAHFAPSICCVSQMILTRDTHDQLRRKYKSCVVFSSFESKIVVVVVDALFKFLFACMTTIDSVNNLERENPHGHILQ